MATCTRCGSENLSNAVYCSVCGGEMPYEPKVKAQVPPRPPDAQLPGPPLETTSQPRRSVPPVGASDERLVVPRAGTTQSSSVWTNRESGALEFASTLWIAGNCAIVAGILAIIQGFVAIGSAAASTGFLINVPILEFIIGLVSLTFGALSVMGGLDARLRVRYSRTLVRAILGMVAAGFGIGALLGLVAVILIALSREGFRTDIGSGGFS